VTIKEIDLEFKKINFELRINKPNSAPYPPDVDKHRTLLLYAQVMLEFIIDAKKRRDKYEEKYYQFRYWVYMDIYFNRKN